jgi:hypothetical protein
MKKYTISFALLVICLASAADALADVKIKARQTVSGQSYENTTYIKGKRQRTEQNMGGMQMINLTQCDLKRGVQMSPLTKTYLISLFDQASSGGASGAGAPANDKVVRAGGGTVTTTVSYKDTGETRKMFGYTAKHIITTMETVSSPDACAVSNSKMQIDGWYIDAAFALDCDMSSYGGRYTAPQKQGCQDKYEMKTIGGNGKRGYPVYEKMSMLDESGKETFSTVTEVVELSQATLDASLFEIPADYRETQNASEMYAVTSNTGTNPNGSSSIISNNAGMSGTTADSGSVSTIQNSSNSGNTGEIPAKQPGVVRIGVMTKTSAVGEGISANDLAAAVENTLGEYLKGTKVEIISLQAKLASLVDKEARQKECDYVLLLNVAHKKGGGGGGGLFGKVLAPAVGRVGIGHTGSTIGNIAGQVATQAIVTAGQISSNVKSKDEITLEIKLNQTGGASVLSQQFKAKAKTDGEDIISAVIEQTAQAIVSKVG